ARLPPRRLSATFPTRRSCDLAERLAGRVAAKEAVMKALGIGRRGIGWQEIEITVDPMGKPEVRLTGRAAAMADRLGITAWRVAISHTRLVAIAQALAE